MIGLFAVSFQKHIGFAYSISLGVDLLPEKVDRNVLPAASGKRHQPFLRNSQHTARSAGAVIAGIGSVFDFNLQRE